MENVIDQVERDTHLQLQTPYRDLVYNLMLSNGSYDEKAEALKGQARLAKRCKAEMWLWNVAMDADQLQFEDREWISTYIYDCGWQKQTPSAMPSMTASKYVRFRTNPAIERRVEKATTSWTSSVSLDDVESMDLFPDLLESDCSHPESGAPRALSVHGGETVGKIELSLSAIQGEQIRGAHPKRKRSQSPVSSRKSRGEESHNLSARAHRFIQHGGSHSRHAPRGQGIAVYRSSSSWKGAGESEWPGHSTCRKESSGCERPGRSTPRTNTGGRGKTAESSLRSRLELFMSPRLDRPTRGEPMPGCSTSRQNPPMDGLLHDSRAESQDTRWEPLVTLSPKPKVRETVRTREGDVLIPADLSSVLDVESNILEACPFLSCRSSFINLKEHAFEKHLPSTFRETLSPKDEAPRRYTALRVVSHWMLGKASVTDLATFVDGLGLLENIANLEVTPVQKEAMTSLCEQMNLQAPASFTFMPLNSPAGLFHWRVLLLVLSHLTSQNQRRLLDQFHSPTFQRVEAIQPQIAVTLDEKSVERQKEAATIAMDEEDQPVTEQSGLSVELPEAFDSHFHLDRTRKHFALPDDASLEIVLRQTPAPHGREVNLVGSVAVFCDPGTYPTPDTIRELVGQGIAVAIGLHPKGASRASRADIRAMRRLVEMPEVVGFGEIGLDRTSPIKEWDAQIDVLKKVGQFIDKRHVVILHCRRHSSKDHDHNAYRIMMRHLRRCVPSRYQAIHLHCFSGDAATVREWIDEFPNTYFGFTRIVDSFSEEQREAVTMVDDSRLLLETDAPYFQFKGCGQHSTPALIGLAAEQVALIRGSTFQEVLRVTTENGQSLYNCSSIETKGRFH